MKDWSRWRTDTILGTAAMALNSFTKLTIAMPIALKLEREKKICVPNSQNGIGSAFQTTSQNSAPSWSHRYAKYHTLPSSPCPWELLWLFQVWGILSRLHKNLGERIKMSLLSPCLAWHYINSTCSLIFFWTRFIRVELSGQLPEFSWNLFLLRKKWFLDRAHLLPSVLSHQGLTVEVELQPSSW